MTTDQYIGILGALVSSTAFIIWRFARVEARLEHMEDLPERVKELEHSTIRIKAHIGLKDVV